MDSEEILLCHFCGKVFYKLSSLESHTRWKHSEKSNNFMCEQCGKTFHKKFNLIKHLASGVHKISESVKCAVCEFRTLTRKIMCGHYKNFHRIVLNERNAYFKTEEEFFSWKIQYENKTRSRFVKMSSSRTRKNGFLRSTYFCHRDGNFIPKGKNIRNLKMKGSNKINAHCPAKIDVEIAKDLIIVSYIDTHLGHDLDITRMNLDPDERAIIAEKLASKVPFEQILDETNKRALNSDLKRINLLTKKDLWNIVETFKLNTKKYCNSLCSKTRRKTKTDPPTKDNVLKVYNRYSPMKQNENNLPSLVVKKEEPENGQLPETNDNDHFLCPIILEDENGDLVQKYVVISKENITDEEECLVINSKDEVESYGHQIVYSDTDGIQFCQDESQTSGSDGIQIVEINEVISCNEDQTYDTGHDETRVFENDSEEVIDDNSLHVGDYEGYQICEVLGLYNEDGQNDNESENQTYDTLDTNKINLQTELRRPEKCELISATSTDKKRIKTKVTKNSRAHKIPKGKIEKDNFKTSRPTSKSIRVGDRNVKAIGYKTNRINANNFKRKIKEEQCDSEETVIVDGEISTVFINKKPIIDQVPEYEVEIENIEVIVSPDSLLMTNCVEDSGNCNYMDINEEINHIIPDFKLEESTVQGQCETDPEIIEESDNTNNIFIKLEVPDLCLLDKGGFAGEIGEQRLNKQREKNSSKVLNVRRMISNKQHLKTFSSNNISLENVLKLLSKSDETKLM